MGYSSQESGRLRKWIARAPRLGITFRTATKKFLKDYASERRSTYYADTIKGRDPARPKAIMRHFGDKLLRDLESDPLAFDRFRRLRRHTDKASASTVKKELNALSVMFREFRRYGYVDRNPLIDVDRPKEPKRPEARPMTHGEITATLAELGQRDAWLAPLFRFALASGIRLKEATGLRWDSIDRSERVARIGYDNKTETPRDVPLGASALAVLDDLAQHVDGFVFHDEHGHGLHTDRERNRVSKRTAAAMSRARVRGASFNSNRPTLGTVLAEDGFSDVLIGDLLGHAWARRNVTGRHYIRRARVDTLRPLVERWDCWLCNVSSLCTAAGVAAAESEPIAAKSLPA